MPLGCLKACLILVVPVLCLAADDARPACSSQIQGRMWPEAANHDPKLISRLTHCGQLLICVRGNWHYHWEAPSIRVDQLGHGAKSKASTPPTCEAQSLTGAPPSDPALPNTPAPNTAER